MNDDDEQPQLAERPPFQPTPMLAAIVLLAALLITVASIIVGTPETERVIAGGKTYVVAYGFPFSYTSAEVSSLDPFTAFDKPASSLDVGRWNIGAFALDWAIWAAVMLGAAATTRMQTGLGLFVGLSVVGLLFLLFYALVF